MTKATTVVLLIALCVVSCSAQDRRRRRDRSEPTFRRCPTDTVIIQTDPGKSTGTIKYPDFDVHDLDEEGNTTPVSKIKLDFRRNSPKAGDQKEVGLYPVHVVATDPSNNAATCKFTVQVVDQESPRFTACKPNKTEIIVSRGDQSALLQYEQPKAIDNVDGEDVNVTFVEGVRSGEVLENLEETTEVVWEATDSAGNRAFCKFFLRLRQTVMSETELQAMMDDLPNAVMAVRSVASPAAPGELNDNDLTAGLFETSAVRERQERMPNRMDLPLTARSGRGDNIHILSKHMNIAVADLGPSMPSEGETLEGDDLHALALSATSFRKPTTVEKKHRVGLLDEPSERRLQQGRIFNGDGSGLGKSSDIIRNSRPLGR
uniref:HYR domain-containing protein n=1 Tax=Vitrella brassicaformis TaxID=1169539 RepID=A0A7S1JTC5_9ALVE|mmetsp:Transcript_22998/g.56877  ORF Transcript_22998/g.56877 Transcript_22998/m.56877 type:complete len:375 (+) Transcript_22998:83-1207(+)